ncbi:MAG: hypothetical protein MI749_09490 [Desulfovibrionales bacterium]|nr:hypothetical protein [Desulfovibrionales bacterium]
MIVIDGSAAEYNVNTFANLEELLVKVMQEELEDRVVTDVLVDNASFREEYPHQAEHIASDSFERVEIKSMAANEFALGIVNELDKVVELMENSSRHIAGMFRTNQEQEALNRFTELLQVLHDFMGMLAVLRDEYVDGKEDFFDATVEDVSSQFEKMSEATAEEKWQSLSAILEDDFAPAVSRWKKVVASMRTTLENIHKD